MKQKLLCLCLTALLTLTACTGHTAEETAPASPAVLTNLYDPVECPLPEGVSMAEHVTPYFDPYTGQITLLGTAAEEITGEDGVIGTRYVSSLFTFDTEGLLLQTIPLDMPEHMQSFTGMIREGEVTAAGYFSDRWHLLCCSTEDGTLLADIVPDPAEMPFLGDRLLYMAADGNGNLWIGNHHTALLLDAEGTVEKQFAPPGLLYSLAEGGDGYMYTNLYEGMALYRLDSDSGECLETVPLDAAALEIAFAGYTAEDDTGYDFYYSTPAGVYGAWLDGTEAELVLDSAASGIINHGETILTGMNTGGTDLVAVCSEDLMLFARTAEQDGQWITTPVLYRTAEDIVLAEVQVIEFAHAIPLEDNIRANLINYDTKNRDVRVVTLDYSQYSTNEDPEGGAWRLVTDILNGIISPDIVYGYSDSTEILQMLENGRYTDLMPYFTADETVNPDTVFGCVQKAFTDKEGKLWALTPYFFLRTLLGTDACLGEYAEVSTWTLEEFLDFTEQYPTPLFSLTREYMETYFYPVYASFCDRESGTCSFDSPLFGRYLEFLLSLPTEAEYEAKSPLGQVAPADRYKYYMDGTVPLKEFYLGDPLFMRYDMGTPDITLIGYPTNDSSGAVFITRMTFMMTDTAEDPDLCWDFIKAFMHTDYGMWMSGPGITAMKDRFTEQQYQNQGKTYRIYGNGDAIEESRAVFNDTIGLPFGQGTSYVTEEWHEPTVQYGIKYLDTQGIPLCDRLPYEISAIIEEEFSALAAGHGTVDDCADKIQSRVSLWLAENTD